MAIPRMRVWVGAYDLLGATGDWRCFGRGEPAPPLNEPRKHDKRWAVYRDGKSSHGPIPVRVLILDDNSRVELPMNDTIIEFSSGRHNDIKERMENEIGRPIKTK